MKTLLFGKNGQVGRELKICLPSIGQVTSFGREDVDLGDFDGIRALIGDQKPDVIVNAAAYTAVDKAETDQDAARCINADAVRVMAEEAKRLGAWLVHYSTDYVFDGSNAGPYLTSDPTNPINVYGETKLLGEQAIRETHEKYLIFRTSWVYGAKGNNFIKTMLRLAQEREGLTVVADQWGAPTSATLIADITVKSIVSAFDQRMRAGIYHLCPSGETTWHELARHVIAEAGRCGLPLSLGPDDIGPILTENYPTPAKRPMNSRLDTSSLAHALNVTLPDWRKEATDFVAKLTKENSDI